MALEYMATSLFNHKQLCGGLSNIKGCTVTSRMPVPKLGLRMCFIICFVVFYYFVSNLKISVFCTFKVVCGSSLIQIKYFS